MTKPTQNKNNKSSYQTSRTNNIEVHYILLIGLVAYSSTEELPCKGLSCTNFRKLIHIKSPCLCYVAQLLCHLGTESSSKSERHFQLVSNELVQNRLFFNLVYIVASQKIEIVVQYIVCQGCNVTQYWVETQNEGKYPKSIHANILYHRRRLLSH